MSKATCGENMAKFEREKDERDWRDLVYRTIDKMDYDYLIELIYQGVDEDFSILDVSDPTAKSIIRKITMTCK